MAWREKWRGRLGGAKERRLGREAAISPMAGGSVCVRRRKANIGCEDNHSSSEKHD